MSTCSLMEELQPFEAGDPRSNRGRCSLGFERKCFLKVKLFPGFFGGFGMFCLGVSNRSWRPIVLGHVDAVLSITLDGYFFAV